MAFNFVKLNACPICPSCNEAIRLPETKESGLNRRRYYIQSKKIILSYNIELERNANAWYEIDDIGIGEAHVHCKNCKKYIEFEIRDGQLEAGRLRRG